MDSRQSLNEEEEDEKLGRRAGRKGGKVRGRRVRRRDDGGKEVNDE